MVGVVSGVVSSRRLQERSQRLSKLIIRVANVGVEGKQLAAPAEMAKTVPARLPKYAPKLEVRLSRCCNYSHEVFFSCRRENFVASVCMVF